MKNPLLIQTKFNLKLGKTLALNWNAELSLILEKLMPDLNGLLLLSKKMENMMEIMRLRH